MTIPLRDEGDFLIIPFTLNLDLVKPDFRMVYCLSAISSRPKGDPSFGVIRSAFMNTDILGKRPLLTTIAGPP